jgi:hypothetical protein
MQLLTVGEPYDPRRRSWPEGADYNFRAGQHELRMFVVGPTPKEIAAVESDPVEFGMFAEPEGLFVVARFGRTMSFDTSYQWHRVDPAERVPPPPHEETSPSLRALVCLILIDSTTGIVRALRAVTYSPEFTRAIHRAIAGQAAAPFDGRAHQRWANDLLRSTSDQLWGRTTVRCRGGEEGSPSLLGPEEWHDPMMWGWE